MRILVRCDSSELIGSGHLIRCRSLSRALKERGAEIIFLTRAHSGNHINQIEKEFRTLKMKYLKNRIDKKNINDYRTWLLCSEEEDAEETFKLIKENNICEFDLLIIDHYSLSYVWQDRLNYLLHKSYNRKIKFLVIDDICNRQFHADILINQNFYGSNSSNPYEYLFHKPNLELIGPHYSILDKEYSNQKSNQKRILYKNILVYFGGSDNFGIYKRIIEILSNQEFYKFNIDIILPKNLKEKEIIIQRIKRRKNINYHSNLPSMHNIILKSDICIGAGGTNTWERLLLGLDSLVITLTENQKLNIKNLHKENYLFHLGHIDKIENISLRNFIKKKLTQKNRFQESKFLIDGLGTKRICSAIYYSKSQIEMRKIVLSDKYILWRWANDKTVRERSFNKKFISILDHMDWIKKGLHNKKRLHLIAFDSFECPIGQVRFDKFENDKLIEIDISIEKVFRCNGYGSLILKESINFLKKEWGSELIINAKILNDNLASQKLFIKNDFTINDKSSNSNEFSIYTLNLKT